MKRIAIIGAGPAGLSAAAALTRHAGLHVTLIDEGRAPGGQIFRQPHPGLAADMKTILGTDHAKYERFQQLCRTVLPQIEYRPLTLVWNIFDSTLMTLEGGRAGSLPYDSLIIATGATDRTMPVAGWTKPGVYTPGGAQVLLKEQGCLIGQRVVFCGSSPLLYLAAVQYRRAGGTVAAVLDTTSMMEKALAVPQMLAMPKLLKDGISYMIGLKREGVVVQTGVRLEAFEGSDAVSSVRYSHGGRDKTVQCDAVACGFGLRPETQLAELAGCALRYDDVRRQWYPAHDGQGRCGNSVYVAGDGASMGGADAAMLSGKRAAMALLADADISSSLEAGTETEAHRLERCFTFQRGISRAFAWPAARIAEVADDVTLCRCENITIGEVRRELRRDGGAEEANRTKAATRCGMGRCQGRFCGAALAEIVALETGSAATEPVARLRAQPPVKPLPISAIAEAFKAEETVA